MRPSVLFLSAVAFAAPLGCRPTPSDHLEQARKALFERQPEEALGHYRRALEALRRDARPAAQVLIARALKGAADTYLFEQRKVEEAVSVYRELIAECPESPEALEARVTLAGILHTHFRDLRGAIAELTAALARNPPESAELNYKVARLYFELQDYPQAEVESMRLAQRYETSVYVDDALFLRAQAIAMIEGRRQDAARAFHQVLARADSELTPYAHFELGKLRAESGDDQRAIEAWVEALAAHPQPELVQAAIGRARQRIGQAAQVKVGDVAAAFDRPVPQREAPTPKTSLEAVGGTAEEARHPEGD